MSTPFVNEPCPLLPIVDRVWVAQDVAHLRKERGVDFYEASLQYAQSQWMTGFPAQALLQINWSLACALPKSELRYPLAYDAMAWLLKNQREGQFLGNPTRHFQHLATRMVEPNKELRVWRAWACWDISRTLLSPADYPGDAKQIRNEGIVEPTREQIRRELRRLSPADDVERWEAAYPAPLTQVRAENLVLVAAGASDLPRIEALARQIWPIVYPEIISMEQIHYMLDRMYSQQALQADLERGAEFHFAQVGGKEVGFLGTEVVGGRLLLHKLYVLPEYRGSGLGGRLLDWVMSYAQEKRCTTVQLRVNKHNSRAIRAYLRQGFVFEKDDLAEIGGGFVMDDYVMIKSLS
jgi:ribosomal protein S18 acetylase RimI-like enzyme